MSTLTAWGLDTPRDEWLPEAACRAEPELWTGDRPGLLGSGQRTRARHICLHHCPVLAPCARAAEAHPDRYAGTVCGGTYWTFGRNPSAARELARAATHQPPDLPCWPGCRDGAA